MNAKKQKAIEYCRSLYCDVKENGQKKYTLQEIEKKVQKDRKFSVSYSTISKWATKYGWEDTFIKLKQAGIEKAKGDIDNKIIDEKVDIIATIYKSNKTFQKVATQTLLAKLTGQQLKDSQGNEIKTDISDAILERIIERSEQTLLKLQDKGDGDKRALPTIIVQSSEGANEVQKLIDSVI